MLANGRKEKPEGEHNSTHLTSKLYMPQMQFELYIFNRVYKRMSVHFISGA